MCPLRTRARSHAFLYACRDQPVTRAGAVCECGNVWSSMGLKDGKKNDHRPWNPQSDLETEGRYIATSDLHGAFDDAY